MHKITKGLKKKKNKTKKSKHKEEELFKPEELEAYRKEHQQPEENGETSTVTGNDEWKKFNALTAGIDTFLKKTQDDLDRIKSTSFFQRVPTTSELKKAEELEEAAAEQEQSLQEAVSIPEPGIVHVSESDSEEDNEDDIFDTAYIDALAAADVKLAFIPDSPTEQVGDDPFDTSIAERAILGPTVTRKGKKLVTLGSAVEVLTGRVQAPTCVPIKRPSTRRTVLKEQNLLFDENDACLVIGSGEDLAPIRPSLLDEDDTYLPPAEESIDLKKSIYLTQVVGKDDIDVGKSEKNDVLKEFDVVTQLGDLEDEDDQEFALLAAESLAKPATTSVLKPTRSDELANESWNAFDEERTHKLLEENCDPFDTTFAENIVPGKFVLKVIEDEILHSKNDLDFNPRVNDQLDKLLNNKFNTSGQSGADLKPLHTQHKDLLGGSTTDLSTLGDQPLKPKNQISDDYIEYCDPFDTSVIDKAAAPGQTELKFLEKEFLSDLQPIQVDIVSDDEFDPRAHEVKRHHQPPERKYSSSGVNKTVAFKLPLPENKDVFSIEDEDNKKISKPLTPYYVRENSIPEKAIDERELESTDPFDTSFVGEPSFGKAELKVIESLVLQPDENLKPSLSDQNFNPRDDKQIAVARVVQAINEVVNPLNYNKGKDFGIGVPNQVDLLGVSEDITTKVLTPAGLDSLNDTELSYGDPFDTSIAINILPGKAELKLLETELISHDSTFKRVVTDPDFDPRGASFTESNLQEHFQNNKPVVSGKVTFEIATHDEIDPFDTSIVSNISTGQIQLTYH